MSEATVTEIRPEIVAGCLRQDPEALEKATWLEQREVMRLAALQTYESASALLRRLGTPVRPKTPPLSDWDLRQLRQLAAQGSAIAAVVDRLGHRWDPHPDRKLIDVLKTQPPTVVAEIAGRLAAVGLHDLDDLVPPDLPNL
jgi:hypothetical protein